LTTGSPRNLMHLAPIIGSLIIALLCAYIFAVSAMSFVDVGAGVAPFGEGTGSVLNAVYYVVLVGVGATLLYFLLRRSRFRLISIITGFALTAAAFLLSFVYLYAALANYAILYPTYFDTAIFLAAVGLTLLADIAIFRTAKLGNIAVLIIGGALGAFLGDLIPTESAILILSFLAVYDIFAVYRGPVGKIARGGIERFKGLSIPFKDVEIGLGDLTFYSMLVGHMYIYYQTIPSILSISGILIGSALSFRLLEKKGMFPGLPLPIMFGLGLGFLGVFLGFSALG
jgi:hypothetical protein